MTTLTTAYHQVLQQLTDAEMAAGRPKHSVQLIAVSKTFPAEDIAELYALGQRDFGENYIQEWYAKTETLADLSDIIWHVIGHVQSNKTKYVAEKADWLHTLDRLKIAQRLSEQRPSECQPLQVCIEVNVSRQAQRHGVLPEEAVALAQAVSTLPNLTVRGLMCVAENTYNEAVLAQQFTTMQQLLIELQQSGIPADTLSMGMSNDMALAIQHGATQVRIGSAIFGTRS